jgi:hypothetical protein
MAITPDRQCHAEDHEKTLDSGKDITGKDSDAGGRSSRHNTKGSSSGVGTNKTSYFD